MSLVNSRLGRYELLRQIGSGGMGIIYLAQDTHMPRQVAVKVVRTDNELQENSEASQKMERLFHREMQAIAQLDHPHILPVFDFGKEKVGEVLYTYLVMQYRPEGSLTDWLRQARNNAALPFAEVARFIGQAGEALQHAHDHGIIHQDVKPQNFLLRARSSQPEELPDLLLADFGLARLFASTTSQNMSQSQDVRGTPAFMAPEQWDGKTVPASDQYSLAIMAFRMLTGQLPFQGSLGQIMRYHYMAPPPEPSSLNPQLGPAIDMIIQRALAKKPEERFPSIMAFARTFVQARPASENQPTSAPGRLPTQSQGQISTLLPQRPEVLSADPSGMWSAQGQAQIPTLLPQRPGIQPTPLTPRPTSDYSPTLSASHLSAQLEQSAPLNGPSAGQAPTLLPVQAPISDTLSPQVQSSPSLSINQPASPAPLSEPVQPSRPDLTHVTASNMHILNQSASLPMLTPGPVSPSGLLNNSVAGTPIPTPTPIAPALPLSNPGIITPGLSLPATPKAREANTPPVSAQMPAYTFPQNTGKAHIPPVSAQVLAQHSPQEAASYSAPSLPGILPRTQAEQGDAPRKKFSVLQLTLILGLVALLILGGGGVLLFRSVNAPKNNVANNASEQGQAQTGGSLLPGQTPGSSNGGIGSTHLSTPTSGRSTPHPGSTPGTGGSTPTSAPTSPRTTPTAAPTKAPPTATPQPTTPSCVTDTWTSHLNPTFSKGGSARYVSGNCRGVVYLTLTQAPASGGHEVDLQICYALNSTNCSGWVAYTSPNAWLTMAAGLAKGQVFYINSRCKSCTASVTLSGSAKY